MIDCCKIFFMLFSFVTDILKKCTPVNADFFTLTGFKLSTFVVHEYLLYSAFAGSGSLLLMRGFQIFAKRK